MVVCAIRATWQATEAIISLKPIPSYRPKYNNGYKAVCATAKFEKQKL